MINGSGYVERYLGVKRDNPGVGWGVGWGKKELFVKAPETGTLGRNLEQIFCPQRSTLSQK